MFFFYSFLLAVAFLLMSPVFLVKREKYLSGLRQRLGFLPQFAFDEREVVWLHCVSVGETNAARPLVEALRRDFQELRLVISTTTKTGHELAADIFKESADAVFYFPFDFKYCVRRALANYKPAAVLIVETEIWPNFLREAGKLGVKVAIVNGRLSPTSFRNYSYIKTFMRRVLTYLDLALMQSNADATRLMALGAHPTKVKVTGNIKFDQTTEASPLTNEFRDRFAISSESPLIVAASTHSPEEDILLDALTRLRNESHVQNARMMIVPRHPQRFDEVAKLVLDKGFTLARRSAEASRNDKVADVILLDSIGELRTVYALAEVVFVGGSLIPHGGQSILEPALEARAIVTGPHTANFAAAVTEFLSRDALIQIGAAGESDFASLLADSFRELLANPARRQELGQNASAVMTRNGGATAQTMKNLRNLFSGNR